MFLCLRFEVYVDRHLRRRCDFNLDSHRTFWKSWHLKFSFCIWSLVKL